MQTAETLKRQIRTAEDLHSLVKTMKAMAAANIRHLEQAVESLGDYNRTVHLGLRILLKRHSELMLSARTARGENLCAVVFGSDQGMCGQLNDQITGYAVKQMEEEKLDASSRVVLAVGARAAARLQDAGERVKAVYAAPSSIGAIGLAVQNVLAGVEQQRAETQVARVTLFFAEHLSRGTYRPQSVALLPIDRSWLSNLSQEPWPTHVLPTFTMNPQHLFSSLIRQFFFVSLFRAFAESLASENASRLISMRGAERNINERLGELRQQFHQQRQTAITEELLDIASGFEALGGDAG